MCLQSELTCWVSCCAGFTAAHRGHTSCRCSVPSRAQSYTFSSSWWQCQVSLYIPVRRHRLHSDGTNLSLGIFLAEFAAATQQAQSQQYCLRAVLHLLQLAAHLTPGCHGHAGAAESAGILAGASHRQLHAHTGVPPCCGLKRGSCICLLVSLEPQMAFDRAFHSVRWPC